ncbi:hypothetical protein [Schaalia hyovaginalis]|uniref:Uncharacterized protein n=1 Tax=Schaalia hyovaginalis TaxID=29316 RepID=A0A923E3U3_9ACTO|nr:hypothetical protein [Schaalia hyovaginalis]MBB6335548.1 hypothetical protein [Schaalia hyovaginalis]MDY2669239.1 hypothetical protein [Schaalia hyovaginalis]
MSQIIDSTKAGSRAVGTTRGTQVLLFFFIPPALFPAALVFVRLLIEVFNGSLAPQDNPLELGLRGLHDLSISNETLFSTNIGALAIFLGASFAERLRKQQQEITMSTDSASQWFEAQRTRSIFFFGDSMAAIIAVFISSEIASISTLNFIRRVLETNYVGAQSGFFAMSLHWAIYVFVYASVFVFDADREERTNPDRIVRLADVEFAIEDLSRLTERHSDSHEDVGVSSFRRQTRRGRDRDDAGDKILTAIRTERARRAQTPDAPQDEQEGKPRTPISQFAWYALPIIVTFASGVLSVLQTSRSFEPVKSTIPVLVVLSLLFVALIYNSKTYLHARLCHQPTRASAFLAFLLVLIAICMELLLIMLLLVSAADESAIGVGIVGTLTGTLLALLRSGMLLFPRFLKPRSDFHYFAQNAASSLRSEQKELMNHLVNMKIPLLDDANGRRGLASQHRRIRRSHKGRLS